MEDVECAIQHTRLGNERDFVQRGRNGAPWNVINGLT